MRATSRANAIGDDRRVARYASPTGRTVTPTDSLCLPPPRMMPRSGLTSPKSRPTASVTCDVDGITSFVGSRSSHSGGAVAARAPDRHPRVRRVGADESRPAGRRPRQQIAADVARREAERAQPADHHVREVLADAAARLERLEHRRRDVGAVGVVREVAVDAMHQVDRARRRSDVRSANDAAAYRAELARDAARTATRTRIRPAARTGAPARYDEAAARRPPTSSVVDGSKPSKRGATRTRLTARTASRVCGTSSEK